MKKNIFFVVLIFSVHHLIFASQRQRSQEIAEKIATMRTQLKEKYLERLDEFRKNYKKAYIRQAKRVLGLNTKAEVDAVSPQMFAGYKNEIMRDTHKRQYELLKNFIDGNINNNTINIQDQNGKTILFEAIVSGFEDLVREVLNKGADITITTLLGNTPLHQAATMNSIMINLILQKASLLEHKKEFINQKNKFGNSALIFAIDRDNLDIVKALLQAGADPNIVNDDGFTPLHQAILQENPSKQTIMIVKLLLEFGANPTREIESQLISGKKRHNRSPLELAKNMMTDIATTKPHANEQQESIRYANLEKMYEEMLVYTNRPYQIPIKKIPQKKVSIEGYSLNDALRKLIMQLEAIKKQLIGAT